MISVTLPCLPVKPVALLWSTAMIEYKEWDHITADEKADMLRAGFIYVVDQLNTEINSLKIRLRALENKASNPINNQKA